MILLKRLHRQGFFSEMRNGLDCRDGGCDRGEIRDSSDDRLTPERSAIADRLDALGGVDDHHDLSVAKSVDDMRPPFPDFMHDLGVDADAGERALRARGSNEREAELFEPES